MPSLGLLLKVNLKHGSVDTEMMLFLDQYVTKSESYNWLDHKTKILLSLHSF